MRPRPIYLLVLMFRHLNKSLTQESRRRLISYSTPCVMRLRIKPNTMMATPECSDMIVDWPNLSYRYTADSIKKREALKSDEDVKKAIMDVSWRLIHQIIRANSSRNCTGSTLTDSWAKRTKWRCTQSWRTSSEMTSRGPWRRLSYATC